MLSYDNISYGMSIYDISSCGILSPVLTPAPVARDWTAYQHPGDLSVVHIIYVRFKDREGENGTSLVFEVRTRNYDIM